MFPPQQQQQEEEERFPLLDLSAAPQIKSLFGDDPSKVGREGIVNIVWENHECKHWSCRRRLDFFGAGPVEGRDCCQNMVIATNEASTQEPRMLNKPFSDPIVCE